MNFKYIRNGENTGEIKTNIGVIGSVTRSERGSEIGLDVGSIGSGIFEKLGDKWLTTKEAADFLRISSKSLLNETSNGRIRYYKFGRRNRFLLSDLSKLLLAQSRGGLHEY